VCRSGRELGGSEEIKDLGRGSEGKGMTVEDEDGGF
jgi:hypothetical protein